MAFCGGTWITQNKVLPGAYINVVSAGIASAALSDRGIATMPLELDWGPEDKIFKVTTGDMQKYSKKIFGYGYTDEKMKGLRDLFAGGTLVLYAYRLNGGGVKAANDYATAKYTGIRGNDIKISIAKDIDDPDSWNVTTYLDTSRIEVQNVKKAADLKDNDYVSFKTESMELAAVASAALTGGTNGTVDGDAHAKYQAKAEAYGFNTMGVVITDEVTKKLYVAYVKRMRDEVGKKFQLVLYKSDADYMGVISTPNKTTDEGWPEASAVYWLTGVECSTAVNKSCEGRVYDGEFSIEPIDNDLEDYIKKGQLVFDRNDDEIEILSDINTHITITEDCNEFFCDNQTIRVVDQLANDDALLFKTRFRGKFPNDDPGRNSLKSGLCEIREKLQNLRAIENFKRDNVTVEQGESKKSVVVNNTVEVVNAMSIMYMTTVVK
jgi:hypothetical protein